MDEIDRLNAIEEIKRAKARYFRGIDAGDAELVRAILADDCVLDFVGCFTDPKTGQDFLPALNVVLRGPASWPSKGIVRMGIVCVHQGHQSEITFTSDTSADAVFAMSDRLFMPDGAPFSAVTGYGHYHETWEKTGGSWKIKTLRVSRLRVEAA